MKYLLFMKKIISLLCLLGLGVINLIGQTNMVDKIVTRGGDTLRCELMLPPVQSDKLFYWVPVGGDNTAESEMKFISYREVLLIYEGSSKRYYSINTNDQWVEIISKNPHKQPELKNRIMVAGGFEYETKTGVSMPVIQVEYMRFQWGNLGVGLTTDFGVANMTGYYDVFGHITGETVTDISLFVGLKASQRFYQYNSNSFFHIDLALGYQYINRVQSRFSKLELYAKYGYVATFGWELLLSRKSGSALDFCLKLHNSSIGASVGFKFGK